MSNLKVLVVGASIAGPATAYWLARTGAHVTVIERFPALRTNGQNIDIRTAGVSVMRKTPGMEAAVRAKTTQMDGMSYVRDDGRPYGTIRATGNPDQQSLISEYEIFRGDLSRILVDLSEATGGVEYVFGEQVASIRQDEKNADAPVTVEFANGKLPTSEYDLVVACDGATSRTRAIGFSCGARDHVKRTNCWSAYFSMKQDLLDGGKIAKAHTAVGGRFVAVGPDPSGVTRIGLMAINPRDDIDRTLELREAMKRGDDELKRFVAQHFEGTGWKTPEILKGLMEADDFYASEAVQVRVPQLSKGRFVLVGDAGYAPSFTGTGTTLALTGAYMLAGEVGKHRGDLAAGLRGYEERMKPIIDEMQKVPALVPAVMAPYTAWGLWIRNTIFAIVTNSGIIDFAQKYLAGAFASTDQYPLPDYEWVR